MPSCPGMRHPCHVCQRPFLFKHSLPCFWSRCTSEAGSSSVLPAYLIIVSWPCVAALIAGSRYAGYEAISLFHLDRPAMMPVPATDGATTGARLYNVPTFGILRPA